MYCMYTINSASSSSKSRLFASSCGQKNYKFPNDILKGIYCWKYVRVIDLTAWDERKSYEPFLVSGLVVRLLSPYLGSAKELSSKRGASINRVGGKASFTEAKLAHKTPLSPAAKAHTKSLLTAIIPHLLWFSAELQSQCSPPRPELPRNFAGYELFQDQQGRVFWTHACCSRKREVSTASCPIVWSGSALWAVNGPLALTSTLI